MKAHRLRKELRMQDADRPQDLPPTNEGAKYAQGAALARQNAKVYTPLCAVGGEAFGFLGDLQAGRRGTLHGRGRGLPPAAARRQR